jgi:hypothetical protein
MHIKIRKQRLGGAKITANLPINAASRAYVDAETHRVRNSVIPIIGDRNSRPYLVGSAVALTFRDRRFLVTAYHVLSGCADRPLFYFDAEGYARTLCCNFQFSEQQDLAAIELNEQDVEALCHVPFLDEQTIGSAAGSDGRFYASVAGYPHTAARLIDKKTIDTPMEVYSNNGREDIGGFISVMFDKGRGAWGEHDHKLARDPIGKSGGAFFGIPLSGLNGVQTEAAIKLVGIPTDWNRNEKSIVGPGAMMLTKLLESMSG